MKKSYKLIALVLATFLCISMCACSAFGNLVSSTTYNTGALKDGYTNVSVVDGIKFCVPSDIKESAVTEEEYMSLTLGALGSEEAMQEFMKATLEIQSSKQYLLMNYTKGSFLVTPIDLDVSLADIDNAQELEKALKDEDVKGLTLENSHLKSSLNNVTKMICPVKGNLNGENDNLTEDIMVTGYLAVMENSDGNAYLMIAVYTEDTEDTKESSKYIAKSLEFTGEEVAKPNKSDSDSDEGDKKNPTVNNNPVTQPTNNNVEQNNGSGSSNKPVSSTLKSFTLTIDNKEISLPIKLSSLENKLGFELDDDDKGQTLEKGDSVLAILNGPSETMLFVKAVNRNSDTALPISECDVYSIMADVYDLYGYDNNSNPIISVTLPCNIKVNKSTYQDVLTAYGEPDDMYDESDSDYMILTWYLPESEFDYQSSMEIMIEKETNLVCEFTYGRTFRDPIY